MKLFACVAVAFAFLGCAAEEPERTGRGGESPETPGEQTPDETPGPEADFEADLQRGEALDLSLRFIPLEEVTADPAALVGEEFITIGAVQQSCTKAGCWAALRPIENRSGKAIVTRFKDYGFFIPLDARGSDARVQTTVVKVGGSYELESSGIELRDPQ